MKRMICCLIMLLVVIGVTRTFAQTLVFHLASGTTTKVELTSDFRMTNIGGKTIISLPDGTTQEFAQSDILTVTYTEKRGDVNRDGAVDVADITNVINIMAGVQEPAHTISVTTGTVTSITQNGATIEGSVSGVSSKVTVGILYDTNNSLGSGSLKATTTAAGDFTVNLTGLTANTTYYYCAFAEVDGRYYYGETSTFKTDAAQVSFTVSTTDATDIKEESATLQGSLTVSNATNSYRYGFILATSGTPSSSNYENIVYSEGKITGSYSIKVSGLSSNTTYYYRAYVFYNELYYYGNVMSFKTKGSGAYTSCPDNNHPHMIDMGLSSGTKWACCNVGASTPEQYGDYFAWGETRPKTVYNWNTYQYGSSTNNVVNLGKDIAGTSYDAATANWNAPWRMPTIVQWEELINTCSSTWTTQNNVSGLKYTGSNGGSIFIPAAGYRNGSDLISDSSTGNYWSSTLYNYSFGAESVWFTEGVCNTRNGSYRYCGCSVRPVITNM